MFTMVRSWSIRTIAFILLITSNFLHSLGEVESLTDKMESMETKDPETNESAKKSAVTILPGEGFANENRKTVEKESSLKVSLEEKSVDIKQGDLGKTKEVKDDDKKEMEGKKVDGENEVNAEEKKEGQDEVKDKKGEKLKEETGIDLKVLTDNDFEHLTQASTGATTGDWLVLFTKKNNCDECTEAEKEMKIVYERVKHKMNVAKVVEDRSSKLTLKRFDIEKEFPVISLFHHGKRFSYQNNVTVDEFMKFLEGGYQFASWSPVREPYTLLEYYLDQSLEELKEMLFYKKNVSLIIFFAGFICGISVTSLCGSILFHLLENFKDEDEGCLREQEASRDLASAKNKAD